MTEQYMRNVFSSEYIVMKYYPSRFGGQPFNKIWKRKYKRTKTIVSNLDFEVRYDRFAWALDYCERTGWTSVDVVTGETFDRLIFERFPDGNIDLSWWEE